LIPPCSPARQCVTVRDTEKSWTKKIRGKAERDVTIVTMVTYRRRGATLIGARGRQYLDLAGLLVLRPVVRDGGSCPGVVGGGGGGGGSGVRCRHELVAGGYYLGVYPTVTAPSLLTLK